MVHYVFCAACCLLVTSDNLIWFLSSLDNISLGCEGTSFVSAFFLIKTLGDD